MIGGEKAALVSQLMQDPSGFVDTKPMQAITLLLAEEEEQLQEAVADLVDAAEADLDVDVHDPAERAEQLRAGLKGMVTSDIPATWVRQTAPIENADEAAQYAGVDADGWGEQCATWAQRWRDNDLEGTDAELADAHIRSRYGVTKAEFEAVVVEWDGDRTSRALRDMLAGPIETAQDRIRDVTDCLQEE